MNQISIHPLPLPIREEGPQYSTLDELTRHARSTYRFLNATHHFRNTESNPNLFRIALSTSAYALQRFCESKRPLETVDVQTIPLMAAYTRINWITPKPCIKELNGFERARDFACGFRQLTDDLKAELPDPQLMQLLEYSRIVTREAHTLSQKYASMRTG